MIPYLCQESLVKEIKKIFTGHVFPDVGGNMVPIHVFEQSLPLFSEEEEESDYFPYIVVELQAGMNGRKENRQDFALYFGIYDDNPMKTGHKTILNLMEDIHSRFLKNSILADKYTLSQDEDIEWAISNSEYYPFFYGISNLSFDLRKYEQEDMYS